jgi:hypothetical protein
VQEIAKDHRSRGAGAEVIEAEPRRSAARR